MDRVPAPGCRLWILFFGVAIAAVGDGVREPAIEASATVRMRTTTVTPLPVGGGLAQPKAAANESAAIDLCRDYVEAQFEYFRSNFNADGVPAFAQRIRSTPGKHDGLYWPITGGEAESPLGPIVAAAAITEQPRERQPRPFSGYYLKVLLAQGPAVVGGVRDYVVDGRLLTGFALVAWPAHYGSSGVHSFLVNQLGDVYARDLGPDTTRIASGLYTFDPDHGWTKVVSGDEER
jgi:hypothetical protein